MIEPISFTKSDSSKKRRDFRFTRRNEKRHFCNASCRRAKDGCRRPRFAQFIGKSCRPRWLWKRSFALPFSVQKQLGAIKRNAPSSGPRFDIHRSPALATVLIVELVGARLLSLCQFDTR